MTDHVRLPGEPIPTNLGVVVGAATSDDDVANGMVRCDEALKIREAVFGPRAPALGSTLTCLGMAYL